ncbi:hypothetical protein JNUCC0626_20975 [Lentzea sp. JNUCC 0626]|uniref:hypothetical protein n=1 Tax=Lentzea sp. JNUCC 0626 TaxID=3367513 RepID=UPI0037498E24
MLTDVVRETTGLFDRRFLLNALLPTLITLGLLGAVVASTVTNPAGALKTWTALDGTFKVLAGTGVVVAAVLIAAIVSGRAQSLIRCYEGLWPRYWRVLVAPGTHRHRRRARRLGFDRTTTNYPTDPAEVMPTRLGNVLRAAESYPQDRYGADAVLTWPRLFPLLPDRLAASLTAARAEIEFQVTISALAAFFAVSSGTWLTVTGGSDRLFLLCYWGGAAVAWATYCGALAPARLYGDQVRVAFDLYRTELLDRLGVEGDDQWPRLNQFWHRNIPLDTPLLPENPDRTDVRAFPSVSLSVLAWLVVLASGLLVVWLKP